MANRGIIWKIAPVVMLAATVSLLAGCTPRMLGVNYAGDRLREERPLHAVVGYYFLNRVLDTVDILTVNVGVGPALHAEAHATNFVRLGAGGAYLASLGTGAAPREAGFFGRGIGEFTLLNWSAKRVHYDEYLSTGKDYDLTSVEFRDPTQQLYRKKEDFWSVGGSLGLLIVGGQLEVHPVQIADWLTGWVGIDFLNDDL
jgi:hypothetical protein